MTATERVEIGETGRLDGDVEAPRILVQEGAQLNGTVTMKTRSASAPAKQAPELEAAVMSALSKQPDARPSAAVLARQLAAAVGYADTTNTARAGVAQDGEVGQSAVEQAEVDAADIATLPIRLVRGPNRDKD